MQAGHIDEEPATERCNTKTQPGFANYNDNAVRAKKRASIACSASNP